MLPAPCVRRLYRVVHGGRLSYKDQVILAAMTVQQALASVGGGAGSDDDDAEPLFTGTGTAVAVPGLALASARHLLKLYSMGLTHATVAYDAYPPVPWKASTSAGRR